MHGEQPIDLWKMPLQPLRQFGLPDFRRPHRFVQPHFGFNQRGHRHAIFRHHCGRQGKIPAVLDVGVDCRRQCLRTTAQRVEGVIAERVGLWKVDKAHKNSAVGITGSALYGKNLSASLGVVALLQAEVLFDAIHETGAQLLLLAVHRKNRHLRAESNNEMAAVSRLECAALLLQPIA